MLLAENRIKNTGADRQRRYRQRNRQKYLSLLDRVVAHWRYRAGIREALARIRESIEWLSEKSGVDSSVIVSGRGGDYGIFTPEEINALHRCLPQVQAPTI